MNEDSERMFQYLTQLINIDGISSFNSSNVLNMKGLFYGSTIHPEFSKVSGAWDSDGTFNPSN
jgi:surface protein